MKVIFLDFDGVLNSHQWIHANQQLFEVGRLFMHTHVDKDAVARLQRIVNATGAKIVVSSTWRLMNSIDQLRDVLSNHGLSAEVIDVTPRSRSGVRGHEIQQWLDENMVEANTIVIIDDDSDMAHLKHKLVQTNFDDGLQDKHVEQAILMLNS